MHNHAESGRRLYRYLGWRYPSGVPNLDCVLKAWSGESVRMDRRHAESIQLSNPTLTLILSAQPDVLAGTAQTPSFRGRGLIGRMLFLLLKSLIGIRNIEPLPVPPPLQEQYRLMIRRIIELPWDGNIPYILQLDVGAKMGWQQFAAKLETELAEGAALSGM